MSKRVERATEIRVKSNICVAAVALHKIRRGFEPIMGPAPLIIVVPLVRSTCALSRPSYALASDSPSPIPVWAEKTITEELDFARLRLLALLGTSCSSPDSEDLARSGAYCPQAPNAAHRRVGRCLWGHWHQPNLH